MSKSIINPLSSETNYYFATLTYENGLTKEHLSKAKEYFGKLEYCLATHETGKNGTNDHIHAIYVSSLTQSIQCRRNILKFVYGLSTKAKVDPHMLRVEKVKSVMATVKYVSKDVEDGKYFVKTGFQETWIQKQLQEQFDATRFYTKWKTIKVDQAPGCIIEYCKLNNIVLTNKEEFKRVVKDLARNKHNIRTWIKQMEWIYSEVMMHFGDETGYDNLLDNALRFV